MAAEQVHDETRDPERGRNLGRRSDTGRRRRDTRQASARHRPPPRRTTPTIAVAILLVLAAPACSSDDDAAAKTTTSTSTTTTLQPAPPTTSPPTTEPEVLTEEEEVEAAYLSAMGEIFSHLSAPNQGSAAPVAHLVGDSLEILVSEVERLRDEGQEVRFGEAGQPILQVEDVSIDDETATVRVCLVDDSQVVVRATGRVVNDDVSSRQVDAVLLLAEGRWRLSAQQLLEQWDDGRGCRR